jgi:tetratricopeptide (TPR) repeat protein
VSIAAEDLIREAQRLHGLGQVPEAIAAYQGALLQRPDHANSWFNLGVLMRRGGRFGDALGCYGKAIELGIPHPEEVYLNRAAIYADFLHREADAEQELRSALAINPDYIPALLNLANIHEHHARRDEALRLYQRALQLDSHCALALARYADMQAPADCGPELVAQLRAAMAWHAADAQARMDLGFALGRALDAIGDHESAFAAYGAANDICKSRAMAQGQGYDRLEHERYINRIISAPAPARASGSAVASGPRPIFVCGMFRSGSTLAEQLLAEHPGVAAGGELNLLPSWVAGELAPFPESLSSKSVAELDRLASRYREAVGKLFPQARYVIDKRPDNFLHIGLIKALFPEARIVHTTRDPLDNCLALYFLHLGGRMNYATDLRDIGHYYRQYRRLMDHWQRLFGADIIELNYDQLVRDPQGTAQPVFEALGLRWEPRFLQHASSGRPVRTASVWQVREPLYTRSSGRARHYARQLAPLIQDLAILPAS